MSERTVAAIEAARDAMNDDDYAAALALALADASRGSVGGRRHC